MTQPKRVLCVGMCVLNVVHICQEYPPKDGRTRLSEGYWQRSGNASNNCTVLRILGTECEFFGILSRASAFQFLIDDFKERGIAIDNCPRVDIYQPYSSILSCRPTNTFTIIHTDIGFPILRFHHFKQYIKLENYKWIHFEGRNPWETKPMINMIRRFNENLNTNCNKEDAAKAITISVELAKPTQDLLPLAIRADLLFVGREFALHLGWKTPKQTIFSLRELLTTLQLREEKDDNELDLCFRSPHIICPWADTGVDVLTANYEYFHIASSPPIHIIDTIGSGDTFVGSIIHALASLKHTMQDAVEFGNRLAIYKMQHRGLDCIKDYLAQQEGDDSN
uniref:Carbohydrate kinase PfkB domain-containing protein n=1 Tax=Glossina brevipalpis TaxID=37001 RepID=A0A1A9WRI5_9MUSC